MSENVSHGHIRPLYRLVQIVTYSIYRLLFSLRTEGLEYIPAEGAFIVAPNHASMLDPPAVGCIIKREVSFFAKLELMSVPFVGWFLRYARTIPVDRKGFSGSAFKEILRSLESGRGIIMFPEGTRTRTGKFLEPKTGVGMAAVKAGVPVIPCWIEGSFRPRPFRSRITLHFLPSLHPDDISAESKKEHYLLVSKRVMYHIKKLHEKHYGRA